jgi:hypothetical protein
MAWVSSTKYSRSPFGNRWIADRYLTKCPTRKSAESNGEFLPKWMRDCRGRATMVLMVKAKTPAPRKPMSTGHKAALARGRAESASVRHYLEALETSKPKRGRKRTPASIDKRLASIESQLVNADALTKLHLLQEQKDLTDERLRVAKVKDLTALEKQFIKVAEAYGKRKGISYGTWRAAGVSAHVLQAAGISRARS